MVINEVKYEWAGQLYERPRTTTIVLHHAAASECSPETIHRWHLANGWVGIGYHFVVRKNGEICRGRPEAAIGAHAYEHNNDTIGICFEGNFETEQMQARQIQAGNELVQYLKEKYCIDDVKRHSDFNKTTCPGRKFPFDAITTTELTTVCFPRVRELAYGSKGTDVYLVQVALHHRHIKCGDLDGIFGVMTKNGVMSFQKANKLSIDGIVGISTWTALLDNE